MCCCRLPAKEVAISLCRESIHRYAGGRGSSRPALGKSACARHAVQLVGRVRGEGLRQVAVVTRVQVVRRVKAKTKLLIQPWSSTGFFGIP